MLPWVFGLVFAIGYAVFLEDFVGWAVAGALVGVVLVVTGAGNVWFWVSLYPLVFLGPRLKLGDWADSGAKVFGFQLYEPLIAVLLVAWLLWVWRAGWSALPRRLVIVLGVYLFVGLLAVRTAPDRMYALKVGGRTFFEPVLLFAMITTVPWSRREVRRVVFALLSVATVVSATSLVGYASGEGVTAARGVDRLQSYWESSNAMAAFLGAHIPIALGVLLSASSATQVLAAAATLTLAPVVVVLTFTRGAWLACGAALGFMVVRLRAWVWAFLVIVLLLTALAAAPPEIRDRAASIVMFQQDRSAVNRLVLWQEVMGLIGSRPLTGYGFGGFTVLFSKASAIHSTHAHNVFLDILLIGGIPMLALFLGIVGHVFRRAYQVLRASGRSAHARTVLGLSAGGLCILAAGLTDGSVSVWPVLAHAFWFILGVTYAASIATDGEPRASSPAGLVVTAPRSVALELPAGR